MTTSHVPPLVAYTGDGAELVEIPTTRAGWFAVARELKTRIEAAVYRTLGGYAAAVSHGGPDYVDELATPRGVSGMVVVRGVPYVIYGAPWCPSVWDAQRACQAPAKEVRDVVDIVCESFENALCVPAVLDLRQAYQAIAVFLETPEGGAPPSPSLDWREAAARAGILRVAAYSLPEDSKSRVVALATAGPEFSGTVQDLLEASLAVYGE